MFQLLQSLAVVFSLSSAGLASGSLSARQGQVVFPPASGPCNQNIGQAPLSCFDKKCVDVPESGVCNIQTQQGFPICGCCGFDEILCSECGGDNGGGICKGAGKTGIAFQGCGCTNGDGGGTPADKFKICPESNGKDALKCSSTDCGGCTKIPGVCDNKQTGKDNSGKGFFTHCAGCPDEDAGCDTCGGDDGNGRCKGGLPEAYGSPYKGCKCSAGGGGPIIIPPIFPFPVPPPGFPIVPPGTPQPKKQCPPNPEAKCEDCGGVENWCQSGPDAGCPCKDSQCPAKDSEEEPTCKDETTCKGENGKCTIGPHAECDCKEEQTECPPASEILNCKKCGGADAEGKCKGLEDPKDKWKGCDCIELTEDDNEDYTAYTNEELDEFNLRWQQLPDTGSTEPRKHPSNDPSCGGNQADGPLPSQLVTDAGNKKPSELQYMMRETLCNNDCAVPKGLPSNSVAVTKDGDNGCELAIVLPNNLEAWAYRGTQSTGPQQQDCWDSFANITEKCVKNDPATGWVNGPDDFQFYQNGVRALNGDGSRHGKLDGANALKDATPTTPDPPTPTETIGIAPTAGGVNCLANDQGGWLWDCGDFASKFGDDEEICTNDTKYCGGENKNTGDSYCKASGAKCDPNGSQTMKISSYCTITTAKSCSLVIADKLSSFGFPGYSCIKGRDIKSFIAAERSANGCGGPPDQGRIAMVAAANGAATWCLTGSKAPGICAA